MNKPFQTVAKISWIFNSKNVLFFKVTLDADAAEVMGETRLTYVFDSITAAEGFRDTLQSNFDALHDEALAD